MAISVKKKIQEDDVLHFLPPRKKRERPAAKLQPPMTPMIDVTFQLLLFFLLNTTFRQPEGIIQASLPNLGGETVKANEVVVPVYVDIVPTGDYSTGVEYRVSARRVTEPGELFRLLSEYYSGLKSPDVPLIIRPRGDVRWQFTVEVFNQGARAQFKKISVAEPA